MQKDFDIKQILVMTAVSFMIGLGFAAVARVGLDINNNYNYAPIEAKAS